MICYVGFDIEGLGGIATYSRYQIRALKEDNNNMYVYSLCSNRKITTGYVDKDIIYRVRDYKALLELFYSLLKKRGNIDIIIFNHVNISILGYFLKKAFNIKYVVNVYNADILVNKSKLYRWGFSNCDKAITDCLFTKIRVKDFHKSIPDIVVLYDPVDLDFFKPVPKITALKGLRNKYNIEGSENKFIITTVAQLRKHRNKGHRQVLEAMSKINDQSINYHIVGGGEDRKNLEQLVAEFGIQDRVKFFDSVDNEDIPLFYNASDVVALISKHRSGLEGEGLPLGLIEASACEKPIVCGNEDGSIEAIDGKNLNGFAINPDDVGELVKILQLYLHDRELGKLHGKNGRKYVENNFGYKIFKIKQNEIIKELMAKE